MSSYRMVFERKSFPLSLFCFARSFCNMLKTMDHIRILGIGLELACNWGWCGVSVKWKKKRLSFLMIFLRMSLHCKLVPVQYREYEYGLLQTWCHHINRWDSTASGNSCIYNPGQNTALLPTYGLSVHPPPLPLPTLITMLSWSIQIGPLFQHCFVGEEASEKEHDLPLDVT